MTCEAGSAYDVSACACTAGHYGDGYSCQPCRACSGNATVLATCGVNSTVDVARCACNTGFFGDGTW